LAEAEGIVVMNDIKRVLRIAAWRLFILDLLARLTVTTTVALVGLILLRLVAAIFILKFSWPAAFAVAFGGAGLAAATWSVLVRARGGAVARELDERADLRESLSTAMCVHTNPDPWAQAVVETAQERARRVVVRDAIPIAAPRLLPVPFAAAVALVIAWFSIPPEFQWTKRFAEKQKEQEVREVKTDIQAKKNDLQEALKKAKVEIKEEPKAEGDGAKPEQKDPEAMRRAEVKRLTNVADRLNQLKEGEKAEQLKAAREQMSKLKQPGPGPLEELSRQLARGNFEESKKALDDLAKKLADSSLTQEQKKQLEAQLAKMSDQLSKLSEDRQAMEKKLQEAGLSKEEAKKAAADPQALQKALEQMKNLTEEQKKQLADQAKACQGACDKAGAMSQAMAQMAKGMDGKQGMSQEAMEGMEALAGQLSEMEMAEADMQSLEAAMKLAAKQLNELGQCKGGGDGQKSGPIALSSKQGKWKEGDSNQTGQGSGGPGKGMGGNPETTEAPFATTPEKVAVKKGNGPIIGQSLVWGEQVKGSSSAEFSAMVQAGEKAATESIDNSVIAPEFRNAVKGYFGRLNRRAEEAKGTAPAAPAGPVEDAPDADGQ
jgi:hypothetical protein